MNKFHNPTALFPPPSKYSHGVETPAGARWLHTAGQVGRYEDGSVPEDFTQQAELAWKNLKRVLAAANMDLGDVVKLTYILTDAKNIAAFRPVWDRMIGDHRPASTILISPALGRADLLVEIEAIAARA